jgi:hypothetical protein
LVHYHSYLDKYWLELFDSTETYLKLIIVVFWNKNKKPKITSRLQLFCNHLEYANSVDKKHQENNGIGFAKKCWSGPHE